MALKADGSIAFMSLFNQGVGQAVLPFWQEERCMDLCCGHSTDLSSI